MKSLKDQLLKAKLVDKKQVRKVEHQERQRKKKLGREGLEQEKARRKKELQEKEQQKKAEQQRQEKLRKEAEEERQARERIDGLVTGADLLEKGSGLCRFHFVGRDRAIRFLDVSDALSIRLEKGTAAIVELQEGSHPGVYVVAAGVAKQLDRIHPDAIRFWNRE